MIHACGGSSGSSSTDTSSNETPDTGGDTSTPEPLSACETNGTTATVGTNHGHPSPSIPAADVTEGTLKTYQVGAGSAGHTHSVTVPAASFDTLQAGTTVVITTNADNTGHTHAITVACA
ncbi:MAG: hypothetical protein HY751_13555 [Nitrospinae bacterium]|nr:hypothetical protein [Nitrospinota bacterium]